MTMGRDFMRKILINFADENYRKSQALCSWTGKHIAGFDEVVEYYLEDIDEAFKTAHADIFANKRGCGLWLWKPYLVLKTLKQCNEGDIVCYCDSGAFFFRTAKPIFRILEKTDIWLTVLPLIEKQFTKAETFRIMDAAEERFAETPQISGSFMAFKKTERSVAFVQEWLKYCCDIRALAPPADKSGEIEGFYAHREDQSILSLLAKKWEIETYSDPSQYGRLPEKYWREGCTMVYCKRTDYKPLIVHHRTGRPQIKKILNQWLCAVLPRKMGLRFIKQ